VVPTALSPDDSGENLEFDVDPADVKRRMTIRLSGTESKRLTGLMRGKGADLRSSELNHARRGTLRPSDSTRGGPAGSLQENILSKDVRNVQ